MSEDKRVLGTFVPCLVIHRKLKFDANLNT